MAKAEASVEELVAMIERGELSLPEMQRRYVWRSTRVRDLLDSLYRGYPSGAILLWETDEEVPLQDFSVSQNESPYKSRSTRLLLDGQQRLTSLSAVIRGEGVMVRGKKRPLELLFNLEHPDGHSFVSEVHEDSAEDDDEEEIEDAEIDSSEDELQQRFEKMTFVVSAKKLETLPHWVKVSEVFASDGDAQFLERAGIESFNDHRYKKYSERLAKLRNIRKYAYRMDVLERGLSYDEVTEIFVRVNSLGAKLRSSDLALAQITAKWRNSLETFQQFQKECADKGYDLDLGLVLKNMISFATGQSRFLTVNKIPLATLKSAWLESCRGMDFAINFLKANLNIDSSTLLSSPYLLVPLAYFAHKREYEISIEESSRLRFWVLIANAKGRYSRGSSETLLDQDLLTLRSGGAEELVDRVRLQFGRLDISADELEGRNRRSALFKTMFLAFRAAGAKDWRSNLVISLNHSGAQHQLEFHHIFPKAVLKKDYTSREADDIANLAFIGGATNRKISSKSPAAYLASVLDKIGPSGLASQAIPSDERLFEVENYKEFLSRRRQLIAERLNDFLANFTDQDLSSASPSVEDLIARGESDTVEFKSSLRWDIVADGLNKKLEDVIMKSISAFANTKGGFLLIGVNDAGHVLGLHKDYESLDGGNRDKFERHLRQLAKDKFGMSYTSTQLKVDFSMVGGLEVCKVTVRASPEPLVMKVVDRNGQAGERLYIRNGNASQELPVSEMHDYIKQRCVKI
jgi:hypothetical protein